MKSAPNNCVVTGSLEIFNVDAGVLAAAEHDR